MAKDKNNGGANLDFEADLIFGAPPMRFVPIWMRRNINMRSLGLYILQNLKSRWKMAQSLHEQIWQNLKEIGYGK